MILNYEFGITLETEIAAVTVRIPRAGSEAWMVRPRSLTDAGGDGFVVKRARRFSTGETFATRVYEFCRSGRPFLSFEEAYAFAEREAVDRAKNEEFAAGNHATPCVELEGKKGGSTSDDEGLQAECMADHEAAFAAEAEEAGYTPQEYAEVQQEAQAEGMTLAQYLQHLTELDQAFDALR